eukprot:2263049-Prymnesium_polylepis.1
MAAVPLAEVAHVAQNTLRRAAAVRLDVPRDAHSRVGRRVQHGRHEQVGVDALRVAVNVAVTLAPPREHDRVHPGAGQFRKLQP